MGFVNEKITQEIISKYNLDTLIPRGWRRPLMHQWTIDKERNIWLYEAHSTWSMAMKEHMDPEPYVYWGFYWGGILLEAKIDMVGTEKDRKIGQKAIKEGWENPRRIVVELHSVAEKEQLIQEGKYQTIKKVLLPQELQGKTEEILKDMKEAFDERKLVGIYEITDTKVVINFRSELGGRQC